MAKTIKVVRFTRHGAGERQLAALARAARQVTGQGPNTPVEIHRVSETLKGSRREKVSRLDELTLGAQVIDAVLPVEVLQGFMETSDFVRGGGIVLRARTTRHLTEDGGVEWHFTHYQRILDVKVVVEDIDV